MDKRARLLIVDDDPMILESLISILMAKGYDAKGASTGEEALSLLESNFFNALIVDLKLPDMTGLELLTRMKQTMPRIRKLILTGFSDTPSTMDDVNQKADAYLVKPFDPDNLLVLLEKNLDEQKEELRQTHERVLNYIKTRVRHLEETANTINREVIKLRDYFILDPIFR